MIHMQAPYMINNACDVLFYDDGPADIVHVTDYGAQHGSGKHVAYASTKAGLENMTLSYAKKLAPRVKVNSIAPFLIMFNEWDSQEYKEKSLNKSVLGIEPGPEVVYQGVRYLMDNIYVTGEEAWSERQLIGKTITINDINFFVKEEIPRCSATNLKPGTSETTINLPNLLKKTYDHINMGIFLIPQNNGNIFFDDEIKINV